MNFGRSFGFAFKDPRWIPKLAVAVLLLLVPVLGWILLLGYGLRIIRAVVAQTDVPLPEWNDWTELFTNGLRALAVMVVWSFLPTVVFLLPRFAFDTEAAAWLVPALGVALNLVVGVVTAAAVARVAMTRSFVAGIEGGPVIRLVGRGFGDYVLVFLVLLLLAVSLACVGGAVVIAVWVGALATESDLGFVAAVLVSALVAAVTLPYGYAVGFHLYGQAYFRAEPSVWQQVPSPPLEPW